MNEQLPKTIAYLRVSTVDQDIEKNKAQILKLANDKDLGRVHFIEEKASGKISWRNRKIADVLEDLQDGDNIAPSSPRSDWKSEASTGRRSFYKVSVNEGEVDGCFFAKNNFEL
jgi:hypothetical protein